jgi:D-sedoheptulose 7-phosphate isomerase
VNPSALTAIANDYAFEEVFERQVLGLAKPGDVVVGISTSGASKNVLRGLDAAREVGAMAIGLCGSKGEMTLHADLVLTVSGEVTSLVQEVHIAIGHLPALLVEEDLFG